jgi:hypothetical protein
MNNVEKVLPQRRLLKTVEVAAMLGVSPQHVNGLTRRGILNPVRLVPGGDLRFRVEDIEALIAGDYQEAASS